MGERAIISAQLALALAVVAKPNCARYTTVADLAFCRLVGRAWWVRPFVDALRTLAYVDMLFKQSKTHRGASAKPAKPDPFF